MTYREGLQAWRDVEINWEDEISFIDMEYNYLAPARGIPDLYLPMPYQLTRDDLFSGGLLIMDSSDFSIDFFDSCYMSGQSSVNDSGYTPADDSEDLVNEHILSGDQENEAFTIEDRDSYSDDDAEDWASNS